MSSNYVIKNLSPAFIAWVNAEKYSSARYVRLTDVLIIRLRLSLVGTDQCDMFNEKYNVRIFLDGCDKRRYVACALLTRDERTHSALITLVEGVIDVGSTFLIIMRNCIGKQPIP